VCQLCGNAKLPLKLDLNWLYVDLSLLIGDRVQPFNDDQGVDPTEACIKDEYSPLRPQVARPRRQILEERLTL
jgi:hypothetical protein